MAGSMDMDVLGEEGVNERGDVPHSSEVGLLGSGLGIQELYWNTTGFPLELYWNSTGFSEHGDRNF